ncbi:MAG: SseB family protein [Mycobacteriales bacterium]
MTDTGLADAALATALRGWAAAPSPTARARVLAALATARVFAAVVARSTAEHVGTGTAEHVGTGTGTGTGRRTNSTAEMSLVTLAGSSGRGVPVFLDVPGVTGFSDGARPVPLTGTQACSAALDAGAVAVVVDPAGAGFVLSRSELAELATGRVPVPGTALSTRSTTGPLVTPTYVDSDLLHTLSRALRGEPLRAARLLEGPDGPVLGIVPRRDLSAAALAALAARLAPYLAAPLDLTVVPDHGPGVAVPVRRRRFSRGR